MIEAENAPPLELHDADEQLNAKLPRMYDPVEDARTAIFCSPCDVSRNGRVVFAP